MASGIMRLLLLMLICVETASCATTPKKATRSKRYISQLSYANNQDCTYVIRPSSRYKKRPEGTFLEIIWLSFDVKGRMPNCDNDYVEVFLTKYRRSIGRYCSENFSRDKWRLSTIGIFKMYSHDGYAEIRFHSDSAHTGMGFSLSYQLRDAESDTLGSDHSTACGPGHSWQYGSKKGVFNSQGWPRKYSASSLSCNQEIRAGRSHTRIAIMDASLASISCGDGDYIQVKGTDFASYETTKDKYEITPKLCSADDIKSYDSIHYSMTLMFHRSTGSTAPLHRGFVVGFLLYDAPPSEKEADNTDDISDDTNSRTNSDIWTDDDTDSEFSIGSDIWVVIITIVVLVAAISIGYKCYKKTDAGEERRVARGQAVNTSEQQTTMMPLTTNAHPATGGGTPFSTPTQNSTVTQIVHQPTLAELSREYQLRESTPFLDGTEGQISVEPTTGGPESSTSPSAPLLLNNQNDSPPPYLSVGLQDPSTCPEAPPPSYCDAVSS